MTDRKFFIYLFLNFLIFFYCGHNNIKINLGDKIYSNLKFFFITSIFKIKNQYRSLKIYIASINSLKHKLENLEKENNLLKVKIILKNSENNLPDIKYIKADVVASSMSKEEDSIFINRGLNSGVCEGDGVISDKGIVGIVVRAYANYSKVLLLTDIRFNIDVILKKTHLKGLLSGNGRDLCRVKYLPLTEKIDIGEIVLTSGFSGIFPLNLPVGKVIDIKKNNLYKIAIVEPFINKNKIEKVYIIKWVI